MWVAKCPPSYSRQSPRKRSLDMQLLCGKTPKFQSLAHMSEILTTRPKTAMHLSAGPLFLCKKHLASILRELVRITERYALATQQGDWCVHTSHSSTFFASLSSQLQRSLRSPLTMPAPDDKAADSLTASRESSPDILSSPLAPTICIPHICPIRHNFKWLTRCRQNSCQDEASEYN